MWQRVSNQVYVVVVEFFTFQQMREKWERQSWVN